MSTGSEVFKFRGDDVFVPLGSEAAEKTPVRWTGVESLINPRPWVQQALCAQTDPDMFFPDRADHVAARDAKAVCGECPVRAQCLAYALEMHEREGIWGGWTPQQRARFLARENARRAADEARERWGL